MNVSRWLHLITIGVFLCLTSICGTTAAATSKSYSPSDVPNPMLNPTSCGRSKVPKSAICDPSLLLDEESKDVIEGFINGIVGAQIAVAVIDEMSHSFVMNGDLEIASGRFARTLHDTWGVGDKETNNGILIFLSLNDRVVYISTGVGVQSKLTRQFIDYLVSEMKPDLKQARYGTAIEKTVTQIGLIISGKSNIADEIKNTGRLSNLLIVIFWCVGAVVLGSAVNETLKLNQLRKGRKALDSFMTEIAEAGDNKNFMSDSCPICLEGFSVPKSAAGVSVEDALEGQRIGADNNAYGSVSNVDDTNEVPVVRRKEADMGPIAPVVGAKDRDESPKRAMALHCGHVFCYECLSGYLKTAEGTKCPICRAPVSGEKPPPPPPPRPPRPPGGNDAPQGPGGMGGSGGSCCANSFSEDSTSYASTRTYSPAREAEFRFRMNRMHFLYPRVMTGETLMALNAALSSGSATEFRRAASERSAEVQRTITNMEVRASAARSGSRGSSSGSFGGGSSGGGGGGSW